MGVDEDEIIVDRFNSVDRNGRNPDSSTPGTDDRQQE